MRRAGPTPRAHHHEAAAPSPGQRLRSFQAGHARSRTAGEERPGTVRFAKNARAKRRIPAGGAAPAPVLGSAPDVDPPPGGRGSPRGLRFPAFLWALLHVPVFLALYAPSIQEAVRATPVQVRAWLWPTFLPQALLLALLAFALALPFSLWPRAYRLAAPGVAGLVAAGLAVDAKVFQSIGYHLNGFFFRLMLQPHALREAGVPVSDVALFAGGALVFLALEVLAGAWFIRRFASARRVWAPALLLLALCAAERVYGAVLTYFGGPAIFAASGTLPLQIPLRMQKLSRQVFGPRQNDPFEGAGASKRLPAGVDPREIRFTRTPDVLFVAAESLPADHLDARTMPGLWRRAEGGALFARHYAGASSTNYTLFSLVYGLQAQKLEATVGAGRQPVLFPALAGNGYQTKVLAASCVDWMGLKETVFGGVQDLETWCDGHAAEVRDAAAACGARARPSARRPATGPSSCSSSSSGPTSTTSTPPGDRAVHAGLGRPGRPQGDRPRRASSSRTAPGTRPTRSTARWRSSSPGSSGRAGGRAAVVFTGDHGEEFRQKGHLGHGSAVTSEQIHVPLWSRRRASRPASGRARRATSTWCRRSSRCSATRTRRRSTPTACRCSRRPPTATWWPRWAGSRSTRRWGATSRSPCTPASAARRSPIPRTGRCPTARPGWPSTRARS